MKNRLAVLTALFALSSCQVSGGPTGESIRTDSAGVEIIVNSGTDRPLDWQLDRVLSLGGVDEGPESFFRVRRGGILFGPTGSIHVLDGGNQRIQVFSSDGTFLHSVGGPGMGPGEFQYPISFAVLPGSQVLVLDFQRQAEMLFDSAGAFVEQTGTPGNYLGGTLRVHGESKRYLRTVTERETGRRRFVVTNVVAGDTTSLVTMLLPATSEVRYEDCGIGLGLPPLLSFPPAVDSRGPFTVFSDFPQYSVRIFRGDEEYRHVRRSIEPVRATRELALEHLGEGESWSVGGTTCVVPPEVVLEKRSIASHVQFLVRVAVSPSGWIWARRFELGEEQGPIDIFDDSGEYQGTLPGSTPWPEDFGSDNKIVALETDDLGIQRAVVYRVVME